MIKKVFLNLFSDINTLSQFSSVWQHFNENIIFQFLSIPECGDGWDGGASVPDLGFAGLALYLPEISVFLRLFILFSLCCGLKVTLNSYYKLLAKVLWFFWVIWTETRCLQRTPLGNRCWCQWCQAPPKGWSLSSETGILSHSLSGQPRRTVQACWKKTFNSTLLKKAKKICRKMYSF